METAINTLFNPFTLCLLGLILALGFIASPYEIKFEDKEEVEI